MKFTKLYIAIAALSVAFVSCTKDEPNTKTSQNLMFHIHTMAGANEVNTLDTFATASNRKLTFSDLRYYISNIVLIKEDGTELPITGKVLLCGIEKEEQELGEVPVGKYKGFKFLLGLDSATNHSDPTTYAAGEPLAMQTPSMHWDWNSGYLFLKAEGRVDTTAAGVSAPNHDFFYHVGMDMLARQIDFSTSAFEVTGDAEKMIHMHFDFLTAIQNLDLTTETLTHSMGPGYPMAEKIANNLQSSFEVENE
ncbi:MAG: hypothetical protein K1X82_08220 [Bacteroidia bacterium]|nr:hypothetical protein [Bacteroidia bacterium]